jgi:hypothetical protein
MELIPDSLLLYFIFDLFNGTVNISDCTASIDVIMNEHRIGKDVRRSARR